MTTQPLSSSDLTALAERTREATEGPWLFDGGVQIVEADRPHMRILFLPSDHWRYASSKPNGLLASAAPALLATALKQQEENATLRDAVRQAQGVLATLSNPRPGESTMHVYAAVVAAEAKCRAALSPKTGAA